MPTAAVDLFLDEKKRSPELIAHLGDERAAACRRRISRRAGRAERQESRRRSRHRRGGDSGPAAQGGRQRSNTSPIPANCPRPARTRSKSKACARPISATARRMARFLAWFETRGGGRRTDRDRRGRSAGRLSPRHRLPVGSVVRFHFRRGQQWRHRALPRHPLHQPGDRQGRDVSDRFRGAISRRHHRRDPHRDGGHADARR